MTTSTTNFQKSLIKIYNMAQTSLFLSPMARKKRVVHKYDPSSFRILTHDDGTCLKPQFTKNSSNINHYLTTDDIIGHEHNVAHPIELTESRNHRPNPKSVGFLRDNVSLLMSPICNVDTSDKNSQSKDSKYLKHPQSHSFVTTQRHDYSRYSHPSPRNTRHGSNPNTIPALGTVPTNNLQERDGSQRVWKEGVSFEHQYNSRKNPSYPERSKRHGGFVWDRYSVEDTKNLVGKHLTKRNFESKSQCAVNHSEPDEIPINSSSSIDNHQSNTNKNEPAESKNLVSVEHSNVEKTSLGDINSQNLGNDTILTPVD